MQHKIIGTTMPVLEITLDSGDQIVAEWGELSWMTSSIALHSTANAGPNQGMFGALKRMAGGGSLFMTEYTSRGGSGMVAIATKVPGHILPVEVSPDHSYRVHRHGFLCGTAGIELSVGFQRSMGAGVFGGAGFTMQKIAGHGTTWIELDGEVVTYDLAAGETMRVHPGHVGMFDESVTFDIKKVPGIRNKLFGGDGLFLTTLTGPGRIWLQSLPLSNLANAIAPFLPNKGGGDSGGCSGSGTQTVSCTISP